MGRSITLAAAAALGLLIATPATATGEGPGAWGKASSVAGGYVADRAAGKAKALPKRRPAPEPTDFALFALGVAGLLIGRRTSRSRRG
jgi:hypothetical protein